MKTKTVQYLAAMLSCVGMMVPTCGWASTRPAEVTDIALQEGGLLVGQVLDREGAPQVKQQVVIIQGDRQLARSTTDEKGVFAVAGLRGGQYQVLTAKSVSLIRAWAPNTAPPSAREGGLIVVGDQVVRGQITDTPRWLIEWARQHPWLTTITVISAVAIPVAIAADDDGS